MLEIIKNERMEETELIPKVIHYCWFGGGEIPAKDKKCIESWKKYCPSYEIKQWNESNYDVSKNKYMYDAYKEKKWGFVPDYARLDIIYNYGGIYLDTDVELVKNLDELIKGKGYAGFEDLQHVNLGLGFGAEKGNPYILELIQQYEVLSFYNSDASLNLTPSPSYTSMGFKKIGFNINGKQQIQDGFTLFPTEYLCPRDYYSGKTVITENTYSIHWFNASWQTSHRKRMLKVRRIIGNENYDALVKLKNILLRKKLKNV